MKHTAMMAVSLALSASVFFFFRVNNAWSGSMGDAPLTRLSTPRLKPIVILVLFLFFSSSSCSCRLNRLFFVSCDAVPAPFSRSGNPVD